MEGGNSSGALTPQDARRLLGLSASAVREFAAVRSRASRVTILAWGAVWFVGFGLLWLSEAARVPGRAVALVMFGVGCAAAFAITIWLTRRAGAEMIGHGRRDSDRSALAWVAAIVVSQVLAAGCYALRVDPEVVLLTLQPAIVSVAIGLVLLTSGLLRPAPLEGWMGGLLLVLGCAAPFVRAPVCLALLAGGGVIMVVTACVATRYAWLSVAAPTAASEAWDG